MTIHSHKDVVQYQGVDILTFTQNRQHYVAIKPLCEKFGIAWQSQHRKLNSDDLFSSTITTMVTVGADGKQREMTCLPLDVFPMWLARINTSRVEDPEAAELILDFQKEATRVLFEHFMGHRVTTPQAVRLMVRQELAKERLAEFLYYSELWDEEKLQRLSQLKKHLTLPELARVFDCSVTSVKKANRLYRHATGDFEDKRPEALKPDETPQLSLLGDLLHPPASKAVREDIWRMRSRDGLTYERIAEITGFSQAACRTFYIKEAMERGDYDD